MTRLEKAAEVRRLRDEEGLYWHEIGGRMGLSRSYVWALYRDPDGSKDKARKAAYGGECVDCGARTDGSDGRANAPKRCAKCHARRDEERNARIFEAWGRGESAAEIAAREGMTVTAVGSLVHHHRSRGRDLALHRRRNRELWPELERLWREGVPGREIAARLGITYANMLEMSRAMRKRGVDLPSRARLGPGILHPEHVRRRAAQLYAEGQSSVEVGAALGVDQGSVVRWVRAAGGEVRQGGHPRREAA